MQNSRILQSAVIVSALGYFVDIYDLILFSIVRVPSLKDLGYSGENLFDQGVLLLNMQMAGMLLGGIFWGILGDKKGRLSVLFGSILLYSMANFANGWVHSIQAYATLRLIAGFGLAGELGAGITLVSEALPKAKRGYGTTIVASFGICGALLAAQIAQHFDWRIAYSIGGGLGLLLLALRVSVMESHLFEAIKKHAGPRGDFFLLFKTRARFFKYLCCILIGVPIWYVIGVLITFSPEFAKVLEMREPISAGNAVMYTYLGMAVGDLSSGLLSQWIGSRKRVTALFLVSSLLAIMAFLTIHGLGATGFYVLCTLMGISIGYWALFVSIGAEQFGTNLRSTVTTTVPNFVRGSVVPLTYLFARSRGTIGIVPGAMILGAISLGLAAVALWRLDETFGKELDYLEGAT